MGDPMTEDFIRKRLQVHMEATDAIKLAEAHMSMYYNKRHQPVKLLRSAYIRLAIGIKKGYWLPNSSSLSVIKTGPFPIKWKVGNLAYELQLPKRMSCMYPIISVIHLEPALPDPYNQTVLPPKPVVIDGEERYVIDKITGREQRGKATFYRIRWKGYEDETWEPSEVIEQQAPGAVTTFETRKRC